MAASFPIHLTIVATHKHPAHTHTHTASGTAGNSAHYPSYAVSSMAPIDPESGLPKYKGKKRGRKPKKRQRLHDPNKPKRRHTAYTLFVQQHYPSLKEMQPELQSKDIIQLVARQWASINDVEKAGWKQRAMDAHDDEEDDDEEGEAPVAEEVEQHLEEEFEEVEMPKKRGRGRPRKNA
jgi:hypothetical protein